MEKVMIRWMAIAFFGCIGCGGKSPAPPLPCDQACADGTALRGLRLAMKEGFNRSLQGKPAGMQDQTIPCLGAGSAHIHGNIVTNATVGTMDLNLSYDLDACEFHLIGVDPTPAHNFDLTLTGTISESGTLSAQPTATTSLIFKSSAMTLGGTVYDPAIPYDQNNCTLDFIQDGNAVSGMVCGRSAGFGF